MSYVLFVQDCENCYSVTTSRADQEPKERTESRNDKPSQKVGTCGSTWNGLSSV